MDKSTIRNNHLSIEFGGGFSFVASYNRSTGEEISQHLLTPQPGERDCSTALLRLPELLNEPGSVTLAYCHSRFVMVPKALYETGLAREMLSLNVNLGKNEDVQSMDIPGLDAQLIYASDAELEKKVSLKFPRYRLGHSAGFFLSLCRRATRQGQQVFLHFYPGFFLVAIMKNDQLLMINAFPWKEADDVVYFTLYCCEQYKFDPSQTVFRLSGSVSSDDTVYTLLKKYTGDLQFLKIGTHRKENDHRNLNLSEQFRCAL